MNADLQCWGGSWRDGESRFFWGGGGNGDLAYVTWQGLVKACCGRCEKDLYEELGSGWVSEAR